MARHKIAAPTPQPGGTAAAGSSHQRRREVAIAVQRLVEDGDLRDALRHGLLDPGKILERLAEFGLRVLEIAVSLVGDLCGNFRYLTLKQMPVET